jgi:hypothetical protein
MNLDALWDHVSEPESRAVLEDALSEQGRSLRWLPVAVAVADADADADAVAGAVADADAGAVADADAGADAGAVAGADAGSVAGSVAGAVAGADADADADADAVAVNERLIRFLRGDPEVRPGLKLVVTPGTSYWGMTQVGWLRRVEGDEWELVGARTLQRIGDLVPISTLADKGPGKTIKLLPASKEPEELHRLIIRRCIPATESAWIKHCPKPAGWIDS